MERRLFIYVCLLLITLTACSGEKGGRTEEADALEEECTLILTDLRKSMNMDSREDICELQAKMEQDTCILTGLTTREDYRNSVSAKLKQKGYWVKDETVLLPEASGKYGYALTVLSVTNILKHPELSSELLSQCLMGTPVRILHEENHWFRVKLPDGYIGWIFENDLRILNDAEFSHWLEDSRLIITSNHALLKEEISSHSDIVSDGVWGDLATVEGKQGISFFSGQTPDGKPFQIERLNAYPFIRWLKYRNPSPENLVHTAERLMGVPYLWGGASSKALDGGGLVHLVYFLNGVIVKRDADLQAECGTELGIPANLEDIQLSDLAHLIPGDLLFFGNIQGMRRDVSHVGIYAGNGEFLHCSSCVRKNSLLKGNPDFYGGTERLIRIKRYTDRIDQEMGITSISRHPWYISNFE